MPFVVEYAGQLEAQHRRAGELVAVYVNEHPAAREVQVAYVQPPRAAPRGGSVTAAGIDVSWSVVAVPSARPPSGTYAPGDRASLPAGPVRGPRCRFTVSVFGGDRFAVKARLPGGHEEELVIVVRKRVAIYFVEMARADAAHRPYSLQEYPGPGGSATGMSGGSVFRRVAAFYEEHTGIELEPLNATRIPVISHVSPARIRLGESIRQRHHVPGGPVTDSRGAPWRPAARRTLWLLACAGVEAERLAGNSAFQVGFVSVTRAEQSLEQMRQDSRELQAWQSHASPGDAARSPAAREDDWIAHVRAQHASTGAGLSPAAEQNHRAYYRSRELSPEQHVAQRLVNTTVHEIAHLLGLVPTHERVGTQRRGGWHVGPENHCSDPNCLMWPRAVEPFVAPAFTQNCLDYLVAAPLDTLAGLLG